MTFILMDCNMPVMDGYDEVDDPQPAAESPLCADHSFDCEQSDMLDRARFKESGMDGYLSKPFNRDQLDQVLDRG